MRATVNAVARIAVPVYFVKYFRYLSVSCRLLSGTLRARNLSICLMNAKLKDRAATLSARHSHARGSRS